MPTVDVTGLTAARMLEIEDASVVSGAVDGSGDLILTTFGGDDINAGNVIGPPGAPGADGTDGADGAPGAPGADGADGDFIRAMNNQTGTTYTLVLADAQKWISLSNASAITLTIPTNASVPFAIGTEIEGHQAGAGQVTIVGAGGVTVNATPGLKTASQYGVFGLKKVATDSWVAYGRLTP